MGRRKRVTRKERILNELQEDNRNNKKNTLKDDFKLDWFKPLEKQQAIVDSMSMNDLTIVNAASGTGKSSTVIWKALIDYRYGRFKRVVLIKNPSEAGDDQIGYLSGDKDNKLESHMQSMQSIFHQFMSRNKLINDKANDNIVLDIPNYLLGKTIDNAVIIIEEAQTCSPNTLKLVCERAGKGSIVVVVGDSAQRYSVKKRPNGLKDLIKKVTHNDYSIPLPKYDNVGYIELTSEENMRSELSKFITEIYREDIA